MELHTAACDLLGCELPVVVAGMGGVARSELVAAVADAGGFGFLGMVRESPKLIRREIEAVRDRSARPFGVNLIPAATEPGLFAAELDACLDAKVHAVALFWDLDRDAVLKLRRAGILVVCQVGSAAEAVAAEAAGAQILIAQGVEAGGHVRGVTPRRTLLAQVLGAVQTPVLSAGGLADGRDLAEALRAGAQGGVFGTAFLATEESFAHAYHKQRVIDAPGETVHTQAFHVNWPPGAFVRVLPNSVTEGARGDPFSGPPQVIGSEEGRPIQLFSTDSPLRSTTGDLEAMALYAGEAAGRITSMARAGEFTRRIADAARALLDQEETPPARPAAPAEVTSPICYAAEASDIYMGFAGREELARELNILLEAARAGARVAASLVAEAPDARGKALARAIQADEVRWCRVLAERLAALPAGASGRLGDVHDEAMAIPDWTERLAFVNRRRAWIAQRLRALLPRIRDDGLHAVLLSMLAAHDRDIESAEHAPAIRRPL